ncbi:uncharacterized protein LOC108941291 [Scleropages formosus]|nr:uncharacterized protein LOC108941291 [Scleropages formosus]
MINKNFSEEISALRAEKQEVMNSLQQAQRLLQMQTKAIGRVELELRRQREEHQALKREHELLQAKTREREDRFVSLTEEYKNSKTKQEREQKILFDEAGELSEGHDHLDKQPISCKEEEHTHMVQGNLKDYSQNDIAENADVSCDVICKTKNAGRECVPLQNDKELVQLCCPARTKQDLSDADKTGDSGHAPDEGRDPAPTEPRETVNDGLPQPDYCTAIKAQGAYVYVPGHADMEGTEKGDCAADPTTNPTRTALEPPGSPTASAVFPAGVTPSADAVDTLGVCGASAGQQAPDSRVIQPCMGTTHPGNCTVNEAPVSCSSVPCKYDFIKALSGSESYASHTVEHGEEINEGNKKKETKSTLKSISRVTDEYGRVTQKGTEIVCDSTTDSAFDKRYPSKANEESLKCSYPCLPGFFISGNGKTTPLASVRSSVSSDTELESKLSDKDSHPQVVMNPQPDVKEASGQNYLSISSALNSDVVLNTEAKCTLLQSKTPDKTDITAVDTSFLTMDLASRSATPSKTSDEESFTQNEARQKFKDQHIFVCDLESTDVKESSAFKYSDKYKKIETPSISIPTKYIQNEINLNSNETDSIFVPGNKRFRSSFDLWVPTKGMRDQMVRHFHGFGSLLKGNQNISAAQTVSGTLGFLFKSQDVPSSHTTSKPLFEDSVPKKDSPTIKSTADMLNTSSVHPYRKREL